MSGPKFKRGDMVLIVDNGHVSYKHKHYVGKISSVVGVHLDEFFGYDVEGIVPVVDETALRLIRNGDLKLEPQTQDAPADREVSV